MFEDWHVQSVLHEWCELPARMFHGFAHSCGELWSAKVRKGRNSCHGRNRGDREAVYHIFNDDFKG